MASVLLRALVAKAPAALPRITEVSIDPRVVVFSAVTALVAAVAVGVLPALRVGGLDLEPLLRSGGRGVDRGGRRARSLLLTAQVALSVVLLAVSGLFVSSLGRLLRVETGFAAEGAVTVEIAPVFSRYPDVAARAALYDRVLAGLRAVPGITAAAFTSALPLTGETWVDRVVDPQQPEATRVPANYRFVGPEYFRAIGMPIVRGRSIEALDRGRSVTPAVISMRTANALWPGQEAVGRTFTRSNLSQRFEVVGVVADTQITALTGTPPAMVYVPYWFNNEGKSMLIVRGTADAATLVAHVRQTMRESDPDVAIARVAPLGDVVDAAVQTPRYQASVLSAFAAMALVIAAVGVYAATAYGVTQRRREMNIRVALGARMSQVLALVVGQSVRPVVAGLVLGLAGAMAAGGVVNTLLFQVPPRDPAILAGVSGLVLTIGTLSILFAARRTLRPDPAAALRDE
jgi:predicted permease